MQSASTDTLNEGTKVNWDQLKSHNLKLITNNIGSLYKHNRAIAITHKQIEWGSKANKRLAINDQPLMSH